VSPPDPLALGSNPQVFLVYASTLSECFWASGELKSVPVIVARASGV
jgi:hypothetical protein